jgi:hypothetical protein
MRSDPLAFLGDELAALKAQGLYRTLRVLDGQQAARTRVDGREVVNLSSNNYLGLTTHPLLKQRARAALEEFGVGTGSVRTIMGREITWARRGSQSSREQKRLSSFRAASLPTPALWPPSSPRKTSSSPTS